MASKKVVGRRGPPPQPQTGPLKKILDEPTLYRVAYFGGGRADQQAVLDQLKQGLEKAGKRIILFNCQRYARQERVWPLLVQSLSLKIQNMLPEGDPAHQRAERLLGRLDELIDEQLPPSKRVRLIESLDPELEKLILAADIEPPLVVFIKGLATLDPRVMVELVEFISGSLEITNLCFVMGLREKTVALGLEAHYHGESPLTPREFLEESFPVLISLAGPEEAEEQAQPIRFTPKEPLAREPVELTNDRPALEVMAPRPPPTRLLQMFGDAQLQDKVRELQNRSPSFIDQFDANPALLLKLERLARGDGDPRLQNELAVNDFLKAALGDVVLRAFLAQPPYFDPSPVDLGHQSSPVMGVRMVSEGPSFDYPEAPGLASENGSVVQARREGQEPPRELDELPLTEEQPPRRRTPVRKVRKKTVKRVKGGPRKAPSNKADKVVQFKPVKEPEPPVKSFPPATEPEEVEVLKPILKIIRAGDLAALNRLADTVMNLEFEDAEELAWKLIKLGNEPSSMVRVASLQALGMLGGAIPRGLAERVKDHLLNMTSTTSREVREAAAHALASYKTGAYHRAPPPPPPPSQAGFSMVDDDEELSEAVEVETNGPSAPPSSTPTSAPKFGVVGDNVNAAAANAKPKPSFGIVNDNEDQPTPATGKPKPAGFKVIE